MSDYNFDMVSIQGEVSKGGVVDSAEVAGPTLTSHLDAEKLNRIITSEDFASLADEQQAAA